MGTCDLVLLLFSIGYENTILSTIRLGSNSLVCNWMSYKHVSMFRDKRTD